jgi:hypothetical protein
MKMDYMINSLYYDLFEDDKEIYQRNGCLFQGDIIKFVKGSGSDFLKERYEDILGYLVLSNSCDLDRDDLSIISLSPILPFKTWLNMCTNEFLNNPKIKNQKDLENNVTSAIFKEMNYNGKFTFYIPPIHEFGNKPTIAFLNDIRSIEVEYIKILLENRIRALKPPWREKLGYKVAYLFNRIATDDTKNESRDEIKTWWTSMYSDIHARSIAKINARREASSR